MATDFKTMIGRFGTTVTLRRKTAGSYDADGVYVPGSVTNTSAVASIQPARGSSLEFLPSAQRTGEEMVMYIDTEVFPSSSTSRTSEDLIIWDGGTFKILTVRRWEMTQVYWEAIIVRSTQI